MISPKAEIHQKPRFSFLQIVEGIEGIAIVLACYLTFFLKPLRDRWGLSLDEAKMPLPADEIIRAPKSVFTHAVKINAPAKYVWPWIAQIGQGRGGFYSYEALENLIGLHIYNSDEIIPEFQNPKLGDFISFGPKDAYPLVVCEHGRAMAIENGYDLDAKIAFDPKLSSPKNYLHLTWLWYVEAIDENHSRFISRNRLRYGSSLKAILLFGKLGEPMVFAMDRKMCLGIKKRAEDLYENDVSNGSS